MMNASPIELHSVSFSIMSTESRNQKENKRRGLTTTTSSSNSTTTATTMLDKESNDIPESFVCRVTKELLVDPVRVRADCQHTINRHFFREWISADNKNCPVCKGPLKGLYAKADHPLLKAMAEYQERLQVQPQPNSLNGAHERQKVKDAQEIHWTPAREDLGYSDTEGFCPTIPNAPRLLPKKTRGAGTVQRKESCDSRQSASSKESSSSTTSTIEHIVMPKSILKHKTYKVPSKSTPSKQIAGFIKRIKSSSMDLVKPSKKSPTTSISSRSNSNGNGNGNKLKVVSFHDESFHESRPLDCFQ